MSSPPELLYEAISARLERSERHVARASLDYVEVLAAPMSEGSLREAFFAAVMGEVWRREKLRELRREVASLSCENDARQQVVYFLALDACEPSLIPSFREWVTERSPSVNPRHSTG